LQRCTASGADAALGSVEYAGKDLRHGRIIARTGRQGGL
jgi:hypothetical protein